MAHRRNPLETLLHEVALLIRALPLWARILIGLLWIVLLGFPALRILQQSWTDREFDIVLVTVLIAWIALVIVRRTRQR